jgi:hypothetical protein
MSIQESIESAFKEVPYPGDDCIALHECAECGQMRDDFRGKSALTLENAVLERRCDSLPLLSPSAFHYFIAAYMAYSLSHPDSITAFFTRQGLGEGGLDDFYLERFRLFTSQQRDAVVAFPEFLKSREVEGDDQDRREYQDKIDAAKKIWKELA